jgi:hypothetical protein
MGPFQGGAPSHRQQVALALAPKFAASLSIFGSLYILYDCSIGVRKQPHRPKIASTYHRLLMGLSVCDILMSVGLFTSTWAMPHDTENVWGAHGTVATCEAIGVLEQAGVAAVLYNASLSTYYLLRIRFGWHPFQLNRIEVWLHLAPLLFGLTTMMAGIPLTLYNSGIFDCWIAPFPQGCSESWRNPDQTAQDYIPCERGDNASLYQWGFDIIPKWTSILVVTVNMFLTHRGLVLQERTARKYSFVAASTTTQSAPNSHGSCATTTPTRASTRTTQRTTLARRHARQSYLYVGALYITYIPVVITRLTQLLSGTVYYEMLLTISITIPLQGFWNLMVYLRPRYLLLQKEKQQRRRSLAVQDHNHNGPVASFSGGGESSSRHPGMIQYGGAILHAMAVSLVEGDLSSSEEEEEEGVDNHEQEEPNGEGR